MIPQNGWFWLSFVLLGCMVFCAANDSDFSKHTLKLVHVLFRHGDRTPDRKSIYPNDPHINETYYPWGYGELTKKGQLKEYLLGKALRKRYNTYLGPYTPPAVEARSTNFNRTKASLELVLAGLYPPSETEIFYGNLKWQPIPFQYGSRRNDWLLGFPIDNCPAFAERYHEHMETSDYQKKFEHHKPLFQYLSEKTGMKVNNVYDVSELYFTLATEMETGHKQPKWTAKVFPELMLQATADEYASRAVTDEMKQLTSGYVSITLLAALLSHSGALVKKILTDTELKMSGKAYEARKIFLYSAHEHNLASMLHFLGIYKEPHVPSYGAHLLFEVHTLGHSYGLKILYQNYKTKRPMLMKLPNCTKLCPIEKFMKIYGHLLPNSPNDCSEMRRKKT